MTLIFSFVSSVDINIPKWYDYSREGTFLLECLF